MQINQLHDIQELMILNIRETLTQKRIKKVLFIIISIIYPLIEIIFIIIQTLYAFKFNEESDFLSPSNVFYGLFSLGSLFCTWGMVSVCYLEKKCLLTLIITKIIFNIMTFLILIDNKKFYYFLVYGTLIFGSFITLIIVYKVFRKGII